MDLILDEIPKATCLSPCAYLIKPEEHSRRPSSPPAHSNSPRQRTQSPILRGNPLPAAPRTIILGTWPSASPSQLFRYVSGYHTLYPTAQILLLTISHADAFLNVSKLNDRLIPAIRALEPRSCSPIISPPAEILHTMDTRPSSEYFEIRRPSSEKQVPQGTVLLHVFGTPSAVRACALLRLYRQHYGTTLSLKAIVLDAAPSPLLHGPKDLLKQASRLKRKPLRSHVASSLQGVFAFILQTATSLIAMLFTMLPSLVGREVNEEAKVRQDLNDPKLVPRNARRCYMFPGKNMLFSWKEGVARKGDNRGEDIRKEWTVRREKVGREGWGGDEERFWEGIEALWEGRDAD